MPVTDGTYIVVSALNAARVIDSKGGTDNNSANIQLYERSDGDSQLIHITTNSSDGSRRMIFCLSGKSLDVAGAVFQNGSNVQQYSDNSSDAQKWNFVEDGKTITVDAVSYPTYVIEAFGNTKFCIDVSAGSAASGANIQIYEKNLSTAQRWALVPQRPVPVGTYVVRSALDSNAVLDIPGASKASGANVQLYGSNDTNAQIWHIKSFEQSTGLCSIFNVNSEKALNVYGNIPADGTNVQQYTYSENDNAFKWLLEPQGNYTRNGTTVPLYRVRFKTGSGYVLDAAGGKSSPNTNVEIWSSNNSLAQKWDFEPCSMVAESLPVPASVKAGKTYGESIGTTIQATGISEIYTSWICSGTEYQCRYRVRSRKVGKEIGDWGLWSSAADGTNANDGWGDRGVANVVTGDTARKFCETPLKISIVDNLLIDYEEVQVEVRRYEKSYTNDPTLHAHGNSVIQTIKLVVTPNLTITSMLWTAKGLKITYSSSYKRDGNTITINSVYSGEKKICGKCVFTGLTYSGELLVPIQNIKNIPSNGTPATVYATLTTDAASNSEPISKSISYNSSSGLSVEPSYASKNNYSVEATIDSHSSDSCYVWTGESFYSCSLISSTDTKKTYLIIPPLNMAYQVCWMCSDGTNWCTKIDEFSPISSHFFVWNWEDECAILALGNDDSPSMTYSTTSDSEKQTTTGREYPVIKFSNSKEKDLSISGVFVDNLIDFSSREQFRRLEDAHHAIFRSPYGEWYQVAIEGVTKSKEKKVDGLWDISVKQEAESL